jgi:hypothetical protein
MIYWYQNLYMDETVEKNPKRCKKRVEKQKFSVDKQALIW